MENFKSELIDFISSELCATKDRGELESQFQKLAQSDEALFEYFKTHFLLQQMSEKLGKEQEATRLAWLPRGHHRWDLAWPLNIVKDKTSGKLLSSMLPDLVKVRPKTKKISKELEYIGDSSGEAIHDSVSLIAALPPTPTDLVIQFGLELSRNQIITDIESSFYTNSVNIKLFERNGKIGDPLAVGNNTLTGISLEFEREYLLNMSERGVAEFEIVLQPKAISGQTI